MGIRSKFISFMLVFLLAIIGTSYYLVNAANQKLVALEAIRIADIVSSQVLADRVIYTNEIVQKLVADGKGAAQDFHKQPGFIALPAQFVRAVAEKVNQENKDLYRYYLRSKWNLTKQPPAKAGGLSLWTGSPDTHRLNDASMVAPS